MLLRRSKLVMLLMASLLLISDVAIGVAAVHGSFKPSANPEVSCCDCCLDCGATCCCSNTPETTESLQLTCVSCDEPDPELAQLIPETRWSPPATVSLPSPAPALLRPGLQPKPASAAALPDLPPPRSTAS